MSSHAGVAATAAAHRTRAAGNVAHAHSRRRPSRLSLLPDTIVVDRVTGQEGTIVSGKIQHGPLERAEDAAGGSVSSAAQ